MIRWYRFWGLAGVVTMLLYSVMRVIPSWSELAAPQNGLIDYVVFSIVLLAMIYWEGYKGFHKAFAPRVVSRSKALIYQPSPVYRILAPVFCIGLIGSPIRRKISLIVFTGVIVLLVVGVKAMPQPWRWMIDLSVAMALLVGVGSILWLSCRDWNQEGYLCDPEIPQSIAPVNCQI